MLLMSLFLTIRGCVKITTVKQLINLVKKIRAGYDY